MAETNAWLVLKRWEDEHAGTLARAALDLREHDDVEVQAISVELKTISDDMALCILEAERRSRDKADGPALWPAGQPSWERHRGIVPAPHIPNDVEGPDEGY